MSNKVVLVTGASRGLGKGFTEHYLAENGTTVISAVRNTTSADTQALSELKCGNGSKLIVVKIDSASSNDAKEAASALIKDHGITHIDLVIANAGIFEHPASVSVWDIAQVQRMIDVNVYAVVHLFQGMQPLLKSASNPKLAYISSRLGSIQLSAKEALWPGAYGLSKAAGNYVVAKIAAENEWLSAFCMDPGQVQTDMGNGAARMMGLDQAPVTLKQSIGGMVQDIEMSIKSERSGTFKSFKNEVVPW